MTSSRYEPLAVCFHAVSQPISVSSGHSHTLIELQPQPIRSCRQTTRKVWSISSSSIHRRRWGSAPNKIRRRRTKKQDSRTLRRQFPQQQLSCNYLAADPSADQTKVSDYQHVRRQRSYAPHWWLQARVTREGSHVSRSYPPGKAPPTPVLRKGLQVAWRCPSRKKT